VRVRAPPEALVFLGRSVNRPIRGAAGLAWPRGMEVAPGHNTQKARHEPGSTPGRKTALKCACPVTCKYCGRRRSRDTVGHYCKTANCQWSLGYPGCTLREEEGMSNRVNRSKLLVCLETVAPGLSPKDIIEQSSCYVFRNGFVLTYNDEVGCRLRTPLPVDLTGAVAAEPLRKALQILEDEEVEVEQRGGKLVLTAVASRSLVAIRMESEILLPVHLIEKPGAWRPLPPEFGDAVKIVQETAKNDAEAFITTVIHVHPDYLEAIEGVQATRYRLETGVETPFLARRTALGPLAGLGMTKISETEKWTHFRNSAGLTYSVRRYNEAFADLGGLFVPAGEPATLPSGVAKAAELAAVFSGEDKDNNEVTVELREGKMKVRGDGSHGYARRRLDLAYHGPPGTFRISPVLLATIVEESNKDEHKECQISADKLWVSASRWCYVTSLGEVGGSNGDGIEEPAGTEPEEPEAVESDGRDEDE
jgi:hypothetical protein